MIKLCGTGISNYYNKIKLALLEKGVSFSEEVVMPSQDAQLLRRSPLGKVPFIETEHGTLTESQVILEYLEDNYAETPLYPSNVFERAKCRELIQHLELNVELQARRLYAEAFFGGSVSQETKDEVKLRLEMGLRGVAQLAQFTPFIAGANYSAADGVAWLHLYYVGMVSEKIYGINLVEQYLPQLSDYFALLEQRPAVQKVAQDRAAALAEFFQKKS